MDGLSALGNRTEVPTVDILGVKVSAVNMKSALQTIDGWISRRDHRYVCVADVHAIMESWWDPEMKKIHAGAGMITPDGMPLVWLNRRSGFGEASRVYGPDLMLALARRSLETGYRHFFYGGLPGVADELAARLKGHFPGLTIAGTYSPPYRALTPAEEQEVAEMINRASPDVVWVGLSTPKQERWMARQVGHLDAPVLIGVGAAFDFHSGRKKQAPLWMQRNGLEWLFRLATEPRRLWRRYLTCIPAFAALIAWQTVSSHPQWRPRV